MSLFHILLGGCEIIGLVKNHLPQSAADGWGPEAEGCGPGTVMPRSLLVIVESGTSRQIYFEQSWASAGEMEHWIAQVINYCLCH